MVPIGSLKSTDVETLVNLLPIKFSKLGISAQGAGNFVRRLVVHLTAGPEDSINQ